MMSKMLVWLRILHLGYLLCYATTMHAQERVWHYHEQNGLLSDFTYSGMFDRNNYLWICTSRGLSRFNGTAFSHFTVREGLPDNDIIQVQEDESGVIWASAFEREAAFMEPGKTLFTNINTIIHPDTVRSDGAYHISLLNKNTVALVSRWAIRLVRNKQWIKSYHLPPRGFSPHHSVLFQNARGEIVLFSSPKNVLLHPSGTIDSLAQPFPHWWKIWEGHLLWLYCTDNSLVCIDTRKGRAGTLIRKISLPDSISRFGVWGDSMMLGATSGRLITVDRRSGMYSVKKRQSLLSATAESNDKQVKVLFTRNEGIYVEMKATSDFYHELPAAPYSLLRRGNDVEVLDAQNRWLFPERLRGTQLPYYSNQLGAKFTEIKDSLIWVYAGKVQMMYAKGIVKKLDTVANIKDVYVYNDSIRYLAAQTGAFILNHHRHTLLRLYNKRTNCISEGMDHSIFIGTYHGLLQRHADGKLIDWYDAGFPDIRVTDLTFKNKVLWIATGGKGLWVINNNRLYKLLDENSGLLSASIESIAADSSNHLILGYANGLQRLTYLLKDDSIKVAERLTLHATKGEGIKYLHYAAGKVYGIGSRGLFVLPEQLREPIKNFRLQIDRVMIDGIATELSDSYKLPAGTHDFFVSFSAVNFDQFPIRYRYRNNGDTWTYTSEPEISYHNLESGNYRIEIQALNNYAKPSSVQVLQIEVQRPFYLRIGFILTGTVLLFILLTAVIRFWYRYKYRKTQKAIQQETRLRELELAALKAQINPHFVFNCLNSIKGLIYQQQLEEADLYMDHFARLFRSTLEGATVSYHSLEKEISFIHAYLSLEQANVNNRFGFDISMQHPLQADAVVIPPMLLQPYVENAVKHGVSRLKGRAGRIVVRFEQEKDQLICTISDNGMGRIRGSDIKRAGKGMAITKRRASLYNIRTDITDNIPHGTLVRLSLLLKHTKTDD